MQNIPARSLRSIQKRTHSHIRAIPSAFRAFCGLLSCMDENTGGSSGTRRSGTIASGGLRAAVAAEADEATIIAAA